MTETVLEPPKGVLAVMEVDAIEAALKEGYLPPPKLILALIRDLREARRRAQ